MAFSFLQFKNIRLYFISKKRIIFTREDAIFWGLINLGILFLILILIDSYVFYRTVIIQREPVIGEQKKSPLYPKEIDEVIFILNERQKRFEEILQTK